MSDTVVTLPGGAVQTRTVQGTGRFRSDSNVHVMSVIQDVKLV